MLEYTNFIAQNVAPDGVTKIGVYRKNGTRFCWIPVGNLKLPNVGEKLYSFGAISDIHLQNDTAQPDFRRALEYLNNTEDVSFTCVCGDLTTTGTADHLAVYKQYVEAYSPHTPVYAIAGNHEGYDKDWNYNDEATLQSLMQTYTGHPLFYTFTHGDDVYIMVGVHCAPATSFGTGVLQQLYEVLEVNRNKRCFVFQHVRPDDACGNAYGIYAHDIWGGTQCDVFESLMQHYKNCIFFHGHSHLRFNLQTKDNLANLDTKYGMWSVHIPSLAVPRTGDITGANSRQELYSESEGYVVDVYEDGIQLRGRDFAYKNAQGEIVGRWLPIASYWLDTTLQTIQAKTYVDPTGTIVV